MQSKIFLARPVPVNGTLFVAVYDLWLFRFDLYASFLFRNAERTESIENFEFGYQSTVHRVGQPTHRDIP